MGLKVKTDKPIYDFENAAKRAKASLAPDISFILASTIVASIKENVLEQKLGLKVNSPEYLRRKSDKRPLVNSGDYLRDMQAVRVGRGAAIVGNVELAKLGEFGSKTQPPRPHIRPSIARLNKELGKVIDERFMNVLFGR